MSLSDSWCSPPEIADPLHQFFGGVVGCDPCSNDKSIIHADRAYTAGGLHLPWGGWMRSHHGGVFDTAFSNFPYSKADPWIAKGHRELVRENIAELIFLCMGACSTAWWLSAMRNPEVRNPRVIFTKRLAFLDPRPRKVRGKEQRGMKTASARFEPALIYYGRREKTFDKAFAAVTNWSTRGR